MAMTGDISISQDGGGNVGLHPYLITLVRWCVSCVWSTASVFLHRIVTASLPPIPMPKPQSKPLPRCRQAGTSHLHPVPKVECEVLHTPASPALDVIFVHGLYGSLGNTWRQGDWQSKYKLGPTKVPLRSHDNDLCKCNTKQNEQNNIKFKYEMTLNEKEINETELNETVSLKQINGCLQKILPNENSLITEKFYNNTFLNLNGNNYETQAKFVTELFKSDCNKNCDLETKKCNCVNKCNCKINELCKLNECNCKINEVKQNKCGVGCGCICDDCYSSCWPKDWIKEDFPGARVISINYTSDPYLWRPLWVKGNKRLRLHERADQMMIQLLELGVGKRPIIWVGHSKGGLFIKQIYCEAYEAYTKANKNKNEIINNIKNNNNKENQSNNMNNNNKDKINIKNINLNEINEHIQNENDKYYNFTNYNLLRNGCAKNGDVLDNKQVINDGYIDLSVSYTDNERLNNIIDNKEDNYERINVMSSNYEEDTLSLETKSSLWQNSAGFMFYSVPHRGSPLADIKTPITSRSIELLEISKDCELVLELQERWLVATSGQQPAVKSLVETCRTLMSVLWLRIVSIDSADAGVGSLFGVSVDHREICKPSSRKCLLYTELTNLIQTALNKCQCRKNFES